MMQLLSSNSTIPLSKRYGDFFYMKYAFRQALTLSYLTVGYFRY
jgi:hypothetical protein